MHIAEVVRLQVKKPNGSDKRLVKEVIKSAYALIEEIGKASALIDDDDLNWNERHALSGVRDRARKALDDRKVDVWKKIGGLPSRLMPSDKKHWLRAAVKSPWLDAAELEKLVLQFGLILVPLEDLRLQPGLLETRRRLEAIPGFKPWGLSEPEGWNFLANAFGDKLPFRGLVYHLDAARLQVVVTTEIINSLVCQIRLLREELRMTQRVVARFSSLPSECGRCRSWRFNNRDCEECSDARWLKELPRRQLPGFDTVPVRNGYRDNPYGVLTLAVPDGVDFDRSVDGQQVMVGPFLGPDLPDRFVAPEPVPEQRSRLEKLNKLWSQVSP